MGYCLRHGDYGGASSCYACAQDEERHWENIEAIERTARMQEVEFARQRDSAREVAEEAARQTESTVANAWRLQAESMASRAQELADAGLFEEAKVTCERALTEDAGNLNARLLLAVTLTALGDTVGAERAMDGVVQLLTGRSSSATALVSTLTWVKRSQMDGPFVAPLKRKVREFAAEHANVPPALIEQCAKLGWCEEAGILLERMKSTDLEIDLMDPLLLNGCIEPGLRVASSVVRRTLTSARSDTHEWLRGFSAALRLYECERDWFGPSLIKLALPWKRDAIVALLREFGTSEGWSDSPARLFATSQLAHLVAESLNDAEAFAVERAVKGREKVPFVIALFRGIDNDAEENKIRAEASRRAQDSAVEVIRATGVTRLLTRSFDEREWVVAKNAVDRAGVQFEAWISYGRGWRAQLRKSHGEAVIHFSRAAEAFRRVDDHLWAGYSFRELGWSLCPDRNPEGSYLNAFKAFAESERIAVASGVKRTLAQALYGKAWCSEPPYKLESNWRVCAELYRRAAESAHDIRDLGLEAEATHAFAWCLDPKQSDESGDWKRAVSVYRQAVELRRKSNQPADTARTVFNLACIMSRHDKSSVPVEAIVLFEEAVRIRRIIGDRAGAAEAAAWLIS